MTKVRCEVIGKCFVDGSRLSPRPDGKPIYVLAVPGPALRAVDPVPVPEPAAPSVADPGPADMIEIPDDWREQHHRKVIALAQKILPGNQPDLTKDDAIGVIEAELARRAAPAE